MARFTAVAVAMLMVLAAGVWVFWWGAGLVVVPPGGQTQMRMGRLGVAVREFALRHDRLPDSLAELPADPVDGKPYTTTDLWGAPIGYSVASDGLVTLTSLGADGKAGGAGDAKDIVDSFPTRDPLRGGWLRERMDVQQWQQLTTRAATTPPTTRP